MKTTTLHFIFSLGLLFLTVCGFSQEIAIKGNENNIANDTGEGIQAFLDSDGDGVSDNADSDDDNDGIPDSIEQNYAN
ncbi:MAG TPA: hypothetical protein VK528_06930, partial [Flavobacterium sp.]|nr:hypothetical protein [Flavobacterium sp.]